MAAVVLYGHQSKGDLIGEIVKGSFRFSFFQCLGTHSQFALRVKYKEYERKALLRVGVQTKLNETVQARVTVDFYELIGRQ